MDVQLSGTWQATRAPSRSNYVVNNAVIAAGPQPLGRAFSGGASNVTVNGIAPATLYAPRQNHLDFRVSKILRVGRTWT